VSAGRTMAVVSGAPAGDPADGDRRSRLVASITDQLGSRREATWIVDHAGTDGARALATRRKGGEPLQYVLGRWSFRSVELRVDRRVLIPRPETEQVVEVALAELARICVQPGVSFPTGGEPVTRSGEDAARICVDLGTGSGAIALALATEGGILCPNLEVWATDDSTDALAVARDNRDDLATVDPAAARRLRFTLGSWFEALPTELLGRVDLLVSNPPYVGESEYPGLDPSVRDWEPKGALVAPTGSGGVEGMAAIEAILAGARRWLARSGSVVIEIDPRQAQAGIDAARRAGLGHVGTQRDLAGRVRMVMARR
jgi:release factor glutamine methyltransferase